MKSYALENDNKIDVYVHHSNEEELVPFEDQIVQRSEGDDSNNVGDWSDEIDDYDFVDSDYSMTDDDLLFSKNIDEEWNGLVERGVDMEGEYDSDDLESLADHENEDANPTEKRRKAFLVLKEKENPKWGLGMIFTNNRQYREAIPNHSATEGRVIRFRKSDRTRVRAVCQPPCPWTLFASLNFDKSMQIKFVRPDHTCAREKYLPEFRINPHMPIKAFHKTVLKDLQIDFKHHILRKATRKCMKMINGSQEEQFQKLWDYKTELLKKNPNSTVEIEIDPVQIWISDLPLPEHEGTFKRMYICLDGLKLGFKVGCRKVLGFDGCHLKTAYKAYVVVEVERLDSWRWFVALVGNDLDVGAGEGWTLISDRQKGLLNVIDEMLPMTEHMFYVRYMHKNFKGKFPGRSLKDKLWSCARDSNVEAFEKTMGTIKEENEEAWKWLTEVPFHHWTRSHFRNDSKCYLLLNNMYESFNRCILRAREEGVLVMLEMIREYLMRRLHNKREEMEAWGDRKLTPKITSLVEKYKKWSGGCYSTYAGYDQFEVTTVNGSKYAVDIGHRSCGCKRWDLSGIPCHHGVDCLNILGANVDEYVDPIYVWKIKKRHTLELFI
ncbi:uncharacterized protein LOC141696322 [Apium graveolens]|uniref:uncharacterized protein LOC141696322 n=1 Tax=Apium graveolens TaxID=4045 RepID=UPI003D78ECED